MQINAVSAEALAGYVSMLRERVFETDSFHPYFNLLIEDVLDFAATLPADTTVVALERTLLYGGWSLFGPVFWKQNFISVDCSPPSADERGAYNARMFDDPRALRRKYDLRSQIEDTGLESGSADVVLIPNLVHHVRDQDALFREMARILKPGGSAYVFEPLVREIHQAPDDYLRYTPYGLSNLMRTHGLEEQRVKTVGGPFSAIAYCWYQALQYLPPSEREAVESRFRREELPRLLDWDQRFPSNLVRGKTTFPMAFSVLAAKPASGT
jgi:SAM-dependent methyltransferase